MTALYLMLIGHALADYPLQGDWLSKAKNHRLEIVPGQSIWLGALTSHALIHAGAVYVVTQSIMLAVFEQIAHTVIDHAKCSGRLSYNQDQMLHVACKVVWAILLAAGVS